MRFCNCIELACLLMLVACSQSLFEPKNPSDGLITSYKAPAMGESTEYDTTVPELSSLCLSKDGNSLWSVSDDNKNGKGGLYSVGFDGKTEKKMSILRDLEGVTINPATGDLYLAVEGEQAIYRIAASTPESVDFLGVVDNNGAKDPSGKGLEGITWYKNDTLIVANQQNPTRLSYFSLKSLKAERHVDVSFATYLSDLCYDPVDDVLWISDSKDKKLSIVSVVNGERLAMLDISSIVGDGKAEGLTIDRAHNCIWIGCDGTDKLFRVSMTWKK